MKEKKFVASNFEMIKQLMHDFENINYTLGLMNLNKFFPSKDIKDSVKKFYDDRRTFLDEISQSVQKEKEKLE